MNHRSHRKLRRVLVASTQRWIVTGLAVVSATAPSIGLHVIARSPHAWIPILIAALATLAAMQPDTHVPLVVITALVVQWLALDEDPTSIWVLITAVGILVFHTLTSFMAATPPTATADRLIIRRWTARTALVATALAALYALAILIDQWRTAGQLAVSIAFATVAIATLGFSVRTSQANERPHAPSSEPPGRQ